MKKSKSGIRPVRLFNPTTVNAINAANASVRSSINEQTGAWHAQTSARDRDGSDTRRVTGSNKGQPTPTSTKSQKSLRRGQIFRKQALKANGQINDESSIASKEISNTFTHMTTPTDAQNVSSTHLPIKNVRTAKFHTQKRSKDEAKSDMKDIAKIKKDPASDSSFNIHASSQG